MKISEVLTGNLTYKDATAIFAKYGVNVTGMNQDALKLARNQLLKNHHTDVGGSIAAAQSINAAYDLLKKGSVATQQQQRAKTPTEQPSTRKWIAWFLFGNNDTDYMFFNTDILKPSNIIDAFNDYKEGRFNVVIKKMCVAELNGIRYTRNKYKMFYVYNGKDFISPPYVEKYVTNVTEPPFNVFGFGAGTVGNPNR